MSEPLPPYRGQRSKIFRIVLTRASTRSMSKFRVKTMVGQEPYGKTIPLILLRLTRRYLDCSGALRTSSNKFRPFCPIRTIIVENIPLLSCSLRNDHPIFAVPARHRNHPGAWHAPVPWPLDPAQSGLPCHSAFIKLLT